MEFTYSLMSCVHPYYAKSKISGKRNTRKPKIEMIDGIVTQKKYCLECQERAMQQIKQIATVSI